jgi:hypothetical protein
MRKTVTSGVSLPSELIHRIDKDRGDIPRSKYLLRILQKSYDSQANQKEEEEN